MPTTKLSPGFKKNIYEKQYWSENKLICGIDEVGRSCLAGPIVAAAAILKPGVKHILLKDSKQLTHEERDKVYKWLQKNSVYSVAIINHRIIDQINIYQATLVAMKRSLVQLLASAANLPSLVLVDAMPVKIDSLDIPIYYFNYGEDHSTSIAAASILAKVTRDRLMARIDKDLPGYSFLTNKGYGTQAHVDGLKKHNKTILHRNSFLKWFNT